jgi:hypothetical protein
MLSPQQRSIWRVERALHGTPFLNVHLAVRLRGALEHAIVEAVDHLSRRHELLRTGFRARDGLEPATVGTDPVPLEIVDATREPSPVETAISVLRGMVDTPFPFDGRPLARSALVRLGRDDFVLIFVLHQLVCDQASLQILLDDLTVLYGAAADGAAARLPPLPPFSALADDRRSEVAARAASRRYWEEKLAGSRPTPLPGDRAAGAGDEPLGASTGLVLEGDEGRRVLEFARRNRSTPFLVLGCAVLASWHVHSGEEDLRLGTQYANRSDATRNLVGAFAQPLLLRVRVDRAWTLRDLHSAVRSAFFEAVAHQALSFDEVVELLERTGVTRANAIPVTANMLEPSSPAVAGSVELESFPPVSAPSDPLTNGLDFFFSASPDHLTVTAAYDTSAFSAGRVRELASTIGAVAGALGPDGRTLLRSLG